MRFPKYAGSLPGVFTPSVTVESPGYIHITVRINKSAALRNVYWHLVDPAFSLLELGFEWDSRRLIHISVPLYKGTLNDTRDLLPQYERGEPIFDLAGLGFPVDYEGAVTEVVKQEGRIHLSCSGPDLQIRLGGANIRKAISCQEQLLYGFGDDDELQLICLPGRASLVRQLRP